MGCRESKHAATTENAIVSKSSSKRSNSIKNNTLENCSPVEKAATNDGNVKDNGIMGELKKEEPVTDIEKEKTEAKNENQSGKDNNGNGKSGEVVTAEAVEEVVGVEKKQEEGKNVLDSPSEFFSNHEETIESIIPDGISGKSEYHSPRAKHIGEDVVEGKGVDGEAKPSTGDEDDIKVDGTKEVPATTGEEKTPAADKENQTAASANGVKAN